MNVKLNASTGQVALLLTLALLGAHGNAAQPEAAYTYATRYNVAGQVTGTIAPDPDGPGPLRLAATRSTYNSLGQLERIETGQLTGWADESVAPSAWGGYGFSGSNIFSTTEFMYDGYGRKIRALTRGRDGNPEGLVQYSYDSENFVRCKAIRMNKALFSSPPSDACALGTEGTQGSDRIFRYSNDIYGQVLQEERAVGTSLEQVYAVTTYSLRAPTSYTDANGNKTVLTYDNYGRLSRRKFPQPATPGSANENDYNEYTYDANGNVQTERKRSGATITYTNDALNQVTRKDLSDNSKGDDTEYDYDARGLMLHSRFVTTPWIGVFNQFDGFGRLKFSTNVMPVGGGIANRILQDGYDPNGNRTQVRHPDNTAFNYAFDGLNRVSCVSEGGDCGISDPNKLLTIEYRADGRRDRLLRPGGATTNYSFDNAGRVLTFGQDLTGSTDDMTNTFGYNPAGQINQITFGNSAFSPTGNLNRTGAYNVNGLNQYTSVNGGAVAYDTNGNLAWDAGAGSSFTYDMENRLVSMNSPAGSLKYDPLGRLVEYTAPPALPVQFLYDGDALVAEYSVNGSSATQTRRYVHGDRVDEPWVQYNGTATGTAARRFLHADHQNSVVAHSSWSGAILGAKLTYDAFGIPNGVNYDRFGYTGQLWLKELGLNYYKARMYHSRLGRFLQTDPAGISDQINLYAYVRNDPVGLTDPTGAETRLIGPATPERKAVYDSMVKYMSRSPAFAMRWAVLEQSKNTYSVELSALVKRDEFVAETRTIRINPRHALWLEGSIQSPALGFGHEVDHAYRYEKNPTQAAKDNIREPLGSKWSVGADGVDTMTLTFREAVGEEKAVAAENEMASDLGEPGRKYHSDGIHMEVNDVRTSCKPREGHQCKGP